MKTLITTFFLILGMGIVKAQYHSGYHQNHSWHHNPCSPPPPPPHCSQPVYAPVYIYPMSHQEFAMLIHVVEEQHFDSYKVSIIRQALSMNHVTSNQVRHLMQMLTFESNKLEVAKFAYHRTVDPQNYFVVNSAFTFSSSVNALYAYIY